MMSANHPADEANNEAVEPRPSGEEASGAAKNVKGVYCPDCGKELPREMRYCPDCGTTVADLPEWARWK